MHGPINIRGRIRLAGHVPRMGRREMHGGMRKTERKIPLGKPRRRWKIELTEIG